MGPLFVFLVTVWTADGTPPDVYAMDTGLTGEDCIAALIDYHATAVAMGWSASCEIDAAEPFEGVE